MSGSSANRAYAVAVLVISTAVGGFAYVSAFVRDAGPDTTRLAAGRQLASYLSDPIDRPRDVAFRAEPAPYSAPPVNLFERRLLLVPTGVRLESSVILVVPLDRTGGMVPPANWFIDTPISWASKRFSVTYVGTMG
jgi:hypothetical protein